METVLVRAGALGDLLLLRRTIAALRGAGHRVSLLVPPAGRALVGPGEAEAWHDWDSPEIAALLAGQATGGPVEAALRAAHLTVAYTRSASILAALRACCRRVVGHDPSPPAEGPHASLWLARGLRAAGIEAVPEPPRLRFSAVEDAEADSLSARLPPAFLAIHPGSGSPEKNWPADRFFALAERLEPNRPWLLALGPAEAHTREPSRAAVVRELPLRALGALLSRAGLFVGNDSGVCHLAAAGGAPTLALFGPTDPALWSPLGRAVRCLRDGARAAPAFPVELVAREAEALRLSSTSAANELPSG